MAHLARDGDVCERARKAFGPNPDRGRAAPQRHARTRLAHPLNPARRSQPGTAARGPPSAPREPFFGPPLASRQGCCQSQHAATSRPRRLARIGRDAAGAAGPRPCTTSGAEAARAPGVTSAAAGGGRQAAQAPSTVELRGLRRDGQPGGVRLLQVLRSRARPAGCCPSPLGPCVCALRIPYPAWVGAEGPCHTGRCSGRAQWGGAG